jgi:geranylgeranyl diphosphate synthase type II
MERDVFLERLAEYGGLARDTLLAGLPDGEPGKHLYEPMRDFCARSGKGIRPALLIASCRAFGGDLKDALPSAAALELLHNAFLIHDDIQDQSESRRGVPCLHSQLGVPLAINVGDAMMARAFRLLRDNLTLLDSHTALWIVDEFDHLVSESLEGQAIELGWIRDNDPAVCPSDYLRMTLKKTCWYSFIHPCRIGALIARGRDANLEAFNEFGFFLGAAFQIHDDILNLTGSQDRYGKEILGDIYEGKRTLILAKLVGALNSKDHARLSRFLAMPRGERKESEVVWVFDAMKRHDCIAYARAAAGRLVEGARAAFPAAFAGASGADRDFIAHFLDFMIERDV